MDDAVRDALRIAKRPIKPVRFHHTVARKGYAEGGDPHAEGEVTFAPPQAPAPVVQPDDAQQEAFLKEQLKGSAPQYDPAAGMHTAKEAGLMAAGMIPGTGLAAAAGKFPTAEGGFEPSLKEDIQKGEYLSAGLKGLGAAGDVLQAVPVVGTAAGAALKAPLAVKLATAMAPAARLAREAAPVAEAAQEAAPAARAIEASVDVAPSLTKSQSQEAMKAAWEAGQGNTEKFKNWNHQWNVEEGPKFAKQQQVQEAVPVEPSAVAAPVEEPVSAYQRLVNPAGFYSRAHEVAMNELPAEPRTWQEMYSLLSKAPRVVGEELYWSGLHPEAFSPSEKVSREQIAQLIERNFPQVHPEIRSENVMDLAFDKYWDKNKQLHMEEFTGESNPERWSPEAVETARREVREGFQHDVDNQEINLEDYGIDPRLTPKYSEHVVPGGTNYEERILKHQYNPQDRIHPDVAAKYKPESERIFKEMQQISGAIAEADRNYKNDVVKPFIKQMERDYIELQKSERGFSTPEQVKDAWSSYDVATKEYQKAVLSGTEPESHINALKQKKQDAANAFDKALKTTEEAYVEEASYLSESSLASALGRDDEYQRVRNIPNEQEELRNQYKKLQNQLDQNKASALAESRTFSPTYTQERYTHAHWDNTENPVVHTRNSTRTGPEGEKIWHQEELQSDWAQQGRERGFKKPLTASEQRELSELEDASPRTPEQRERLAGLREREREARGSGVPEAPYTRDTAHWLELAAKDTLAQAIERGYDKIFITGGQEQAKRWQNELRKAVDSVSWSAPPNADKIQEAKKTVEDYYSTMSKLNNEMTSRYGEDWYNTHPEVHAEYLKQSDNIDNKMAEAKKILDADKGLASAYPDAKVVYAKPVEGGSESYFVVKPVEANGKTRYEVIDSSIPSAKGETLSAVIGGDLAKRVMAEESGDVPMKGYRMGSEGYAQTYERKAPSIYKKLIRSLDPEAKVEAGPLAGDPKLRAEVDRIAQQNFARDWNELTPEEQERMRYQLGDAESSLNEVGGTYIQITPKMKSEYARLKQKFGSVFPAYKRGGKVIDTLVQNNLKMPNVRSSAEDVENALRIAKR
jgi:hypothetical protein